MSALTLPLATLALAALGLVVGLVLLVVGLRGRRVDDHPVCRKCGRDLFGLDPPKNCPECGVWLGYARPRVGNRVRRGRLVTLGTFLLVPCLLWIGGLAAITFGGVDTDRYKPVWLLAHESGGPNGESAVAELRRRFDAGELTQERVDSLVAGFLADQADLSREWAMAKGTFVEHAALAGKVSPADWQRYVEQGVGPALRVRPTVTAGDRLPIVWYGGNQRLGGKDSPLFSLISQNGSGVWFAVHIVGEAGDEIASYYRDLMPGGVWGQSKGAVAIPASAAGQRLRVTVDVGPAWPVGSHPLTPNPARPPAGLPEPRPLATAEIVAADQPTAVPRESAEMARLFAEQFHLGYPPSVLGTDQDRPYEPYMHVGFDIGHSVRSVHFNLARIGSADPLPVGLAFEMWIEWPGGRHQLCTLTSAAGTRLGGVSSGGNLPEGFDARRVTVRLVPSREAAELTPDVVNYWGKEWLWENVRIDWPEDRGTK